MKKINLFCIFTALLLLLLHHRPRAQSAELIGGNILNGAVTGSILGTATMGLQNSSDFTPFRIGLGAGILGGTGIAIHDIATLPQGQQFFISGVFNDGRNSSILILLDTVYGAGVGAALGSAIALIGNTSFVKSVQYGASAGAWTGFGFGLVDSFVLAERNRDFISDVASGQQPPFTFSVRSDIEFSVLQPGVVRRLQIQPDALSVEARPVVTLLSFSKIF